MSYGLKVAFLGLFGMAAALFFASRGAASDRAQSHVRSPQQHVTIYPNGGTNGPSGNQ